MGHGEISALSRRAPSTLARRDESCCNAVAQIGSESDIAIIVKLGLIDIAERLCSDKVPTGCHLGDLSIAIEEHT